MTRVHDFSETNAYLGTLKRRGNSWVSNFSVDGRQIRKSLGKIPEAEARAQHLRLIESYLGISQQTPEYYPRATLWREKCEEGMLNSNGWIQRMLQRTKDRAKLKKIPFSLTLDDLNSLMVATSGKCTLTSIEFSWESIRGSNFRLFVPVIDRVDPSDGYRFVNVRILCNAANVALSDWGEAVLEKVARGYLQTAYTKNLHLKKGPLSRGPNI